MKILFIHPEDNSTKFLSQIYENVSDKTVLVGGYEKEEIFELIKQHDRIVMMGHGSPDGLFSVGKFKTKLGFVIEKTFRDVLQNKDNVYIWCYASDFVKNNNLKGFSTGMFISELYEAKYCSVYNSTHKKVDESNKVFTDLVTNTITLPSNQMFEEIREKYGYLVKTNDVAKYNHKRLKLF